jgi:hypothetical protein
MVEHIQAVQANYGSRVTGSELGCRGDLLVRPGVSDCRRTELESGKSEDSVCIRLSDGGTYIVVWRSVHEAVAFCYKVSRAQVVMGTSFLLVTAPGNHGSAKVLCVF